MDNTRVPVFSPSALTIGYRLVWGLSAVVYLTVFVSGLLAGGSELGTLVRAVGFTLATALIGKLALSVLGQATQPLSATEEGTVGSRVDLLSSPNVSQQEDEAEAA
ncbi:MAG TPA: hypothetical protein VGL99_29230 [Chloroflexota bacterium]|jgi:hypothetical protein